jgi:hypothetical protein
MMTHRERMLATLRGEPTDRLPIVPRLDIWYKGNKAKGTLPDKYRNATLKEILLDLDVGYHTAIPDYNIYDDSLDIVDRALGLWGTSTLPWKHSFRNIKRNISYSGDTTKVEYITPYGNITTATVFDESMRKAGITISHVAEKAIKSVADYEAVGYIFENIEIQPNYEYLAEFKEYVGDLGVICGRAAQGSPMHEILHELMPYDQFFYAYYDYEEELKKLAAQMTPYYEKVLDVTIKSPADWIYSGANYDVQITWPAFFEGHILPYLSTAVDKAHAGGKHLMTHTDGENKSLLPYYSQAKFDIADSICPAPMTSHTLAEIRAAFDGKITIWGGIPAVSVLESSMSDYEFDKFIDDLFLQMGKGDHLILSIADTAPTAMKFSRLERIIRIAQEFGSVNP